MSVSGSEDSSIGCAKGQSDPQQFHHALNKDILPNLGFIVKDGLLECMAWQWLLTLRWRCTRVKKGVYIDGHERPDIVEYQNKEFLLLIASFKKCMVH